MAVLTIRQGHQITQLPFEAPSALATLLACAGLGVGQPCGGRGVCGKCAVLLSGEVSKPNASELRTGVRLACQAVIFGDAEVTLPISLPMAQIAGGNKADLTPIAPMSGRIGAAVDIGTTTLAMLLYDLTSGKCISSASMLNPQTTVAADVIGRIDASMKGQSAHLRQQIEDAITALLASACAQADVMPSEVTATVVTGNTTMLYLLTGRDPAALSHAPFEADHLYGEEITFQGSRTYLPHCMHAFVGADTCCALLASGMLDRCETSMLCDVGTNGELALWHEGQLYIASTAAGPAFEGAGISCGCSSIPGAIDQVGVQDGQLVCHTIGDQKAVGICGSGLVDAIASMLDAELMDETGFLEEDECPLTDGISLIQGDIRAVQLAKAATNAGIMSLLSAAKCPVSKVSKVYLAGGFGSHLNLRSAVRIGLIPAPLENKVQVIGNAALDGAALLLMNTELRSKTAQMQAIAQHVRLDGNPEFAERYVEAMLFDAE